MSDLLSFALKMIALESESPEMWKGVENLYILKRERQEKPN